MNRSSFARHEPSTPEFRPRRPKRCDSRKGGCGEMFTPSRSMQKACSIPCGQAMGRLVTEKKLAKEAAQDKRQTKAQLEALKRIPELIAEAQVAVNKFIRLRDNGKKCLTCDTVLRMGGVGGGFDAGHIRARSAAPHLRFAENNIAGQCKPCNAPGGTLPHKMKEAAIARIGLAAFEALEVDNRVHKWTHDELRGIRDTYRQRARELEKEMA